VTSPRAWWESHYIKTVRRHAPGARLVLSPRGHWRVEGADGRPLSAGLATPYHAWRDAAKRLERES
jgi:hypothetical protein